MKANIDNIKHAISLVESCDYVPNPREGKRGACNIIRMITRSRRFKSMGGYTVGNAGVYVYNGEHGESALEKWFGIRYAWQLEWFLGASDDHNYRMYEWWSCYYGKAIYKITKEELLDTLNELLLRVVSVRVKVLQEGLTENEEESMIFKSLEDMAYGKFPVIPHTVANEDMFSLGVLGFSRDTIFKGVERSRRSGVCLGYKKYQAVSMYPDGDIGFKVTELRGEITMERMSHHVFAANIKRRWLIYVGQDNSMRPSKYITEDALDILAGLESEINQDTENDAAPDYNTLRKQCEVGDTVVCFRGNVHEWCPERSVEHNNFMETPIAHLSDKINRQYSNGTPITGIVICNFVLVYSCQKDASRCERRPKNTNAYAIWDSVIDEIFIVEGCHIDVLSNPSDRLLEDKETFRDKLNIEDPGKRYNRNVVKRDIYNSAWKSIAIVTTVMVLLCSLAAYVSEHEPKMLPFVGLITLACIYIFICVDRVK